jgi:GntR family transcriptional repressor for pyruvate dehydrogenase complex
MTTKEKHSGRLRNGSSSEQVLNHLRELIQQGKLKPGERLPAERELAELLQVSRPTLRAGLRSLAAIGVLESRHGSGTYVVDVDGPPVLDASPLRLMATLRGFTSEEMFEARLALETTAAGLAAERATSDELATMAEELAGIFASVDDPESFLVHDVQFHRGVATASHNRILAALAEMVVTAMYDTRKQTVRRAQDLKESAEWHRRTYRAIREHKIEEARETMREHLVRARVAQQQEHAS